MEIELWAKAPRRFPALAEMLVTAKLSGNGIQRLANSCKKLHLSGRVMLAEAVNQAGELTRTQVRRSLQEQTGVSHYGVIVEKTHTVRANPATLTYTIRTSGSGLPIQLFNPHRVASGVQASPWGRALIFQRSFQQARRLGFRARLGAARLPIRTLRGPSLPKEIVKGQTAETFNASAAMLKAKVEAKLLRLMS